MSNYSPTFLTRCELDSTMLLNKKKLFLAGLPWLSSVPLHYSLARSHSIASHCHIFHINTSLQYTVWTLTCKRQKSQSTLRTQPTALICTRISSTTSHHPVSPVGDESAKCVVERPNIVLCAIPYLSMTVDKLVRHLLQLVFL